MEKYRQVERSIIKKYRKEIWRPFITAIARYRLIQAGDAVAVCLSGGKDSMLLAKCMQELQAHGPHPFRLEFLVMDPGYNAANRQTVCDNAELLRVPVRLFETGIFDIAANISGSPCYLCARMRRGHLYKNAQQLGCNKIALGHHFDDVIETSLLSMLYAGQIRTMMPKLRSANFAGMELIRPLYLVREADILRWKRHNALQFIRCACRFAENCAPDDEGGGGKRQEMKRLIQALRRTHPATDRNIFNSMHNVNLEKVIAYRDRDGAHHFLDDYGD